jgi:hypothetical protein
MERERLREKDIPVEAAEAATITSNWGAETVAGRENGWTASAGCFFHILAGRLTTKPRE